VEKENIMNDDTMSSTKAKMDYIPTIGGLYLFIREAKVTDAKGIAKVHVDCWRTTYKNIISDSYLDQLSYEQREELWKKNLSRDDIFVYVAENTDGQIVGFADGGKRKSNQLENAGDLTSIYILKEYQGMGIGKKLLHQLFTKFYERNDRTIFVEVLEQNHARYFYESLGAQFQKSEKINIAGDMLPLLIYVWKDIRTFLTKSP
jgi:ribosomal protein S18 acetylase RimI-like enzyme